MSYALKANPYAAADAREEARWNEQARNEQREITLSALFKNAVERCQVNAPAIFAKPVNQWIKGKSVPRDASVYEVMFEAADDANVLPEVFALLCEAATGRDVKDDAGNLIDRMATAYGRYAA